MRRWRRWTCRIYDVAGNVTGEFGPWCFRFTAEAKVRYWNEQARNSDLRLTTAKVLDRPVASIPPPWTARLERVA